MPFFGPVGRICIGLVSLTLFLIFVADLAFGVPGESYLAVLDARASEAR